MSFVMRDVVSSFSTVLVAACIGMAMMTSGAFAQAAKGASGLPLPRFVSLKAKSVNLRIGPSLDYAVAFRYLKSGVPVEIIQEYDNWRRIRDADGTEGWVNQALLSGDRTALAAPWMRGKGEGIFVNLRRDPQSTAPIVARIEPGVMLQIGECNGDWCHAETQGVEGWIAQGEIWGAYPGEAFK
ncbi:SH3 domain-containing protein [Sinorhizobium garamanticum]|uniref:SH3 domain-containing protein n=1 Tax=Sinorhizobium garamanticum TaxID=680247 RepID=A0ABY8DCI5_9HYPH|nr:SH3 domain-containing protein [Sinorhizobium garamanticum]WEX88591.1 SH3 domain-containing protein [Sinorhizobium garamanticum]